MRRKPVIKPKVRERRRESPRGGRRRIVAVVIVCALGAIVTVFVVRTVDPAFVARRLGWFGGERLGAVVEPIARDAAWTVPPAPENLPALDSSLAAAIRSQLAALRAEAWGVNGAARTHTDRSANAAERAERIGRLGMLYEVHNFPYLARTCYAKSVTLYPSNARWWHHWGALAQQSGETGAAAKAFQAVVRRQPDYAPAHERLGLLAMERESYAEAGEAFHRVIDLRPDDAPGYVGLARALIGMKRYEQAVKHLQKALTLAPADGRAYYLLGQAYQALGRRPEAQAALSRGTLAEGQMVADRWLSEVPYAAVSPPARLALAIKFIQHGALQEAVDILEELLSNDPRNVDAANQLGMAYLSLRRSQDARRVLQDALTAGRQSYLTHANLAAALYELLDVEAALEHAEQAIELAPTQAWPFHIKGEILVLNGDYEAAVAAFRRATELDPRGARSHLLLGETLARMGRMDEAFEPLQNAVTFKPSLANAWYNLAMIHAQRDRFVEAARTLRTALQHNPSDPQLAEALARVESRLAHDEAQKRRKRDSGGGGVPDDRGP